MKVVAALCAEFDESPLGTRSRLRRELGGTPVLTRTVERLQRADQLESVNIICARDRVDQCKQLVQRDGVLFHAMVVEPSPWCRLVRSARKWSLDGWRGGLGGSMHFDEFVDCRVLAALLDRVEADALLAVPAAAAVVDPALADRMIAHREKIGSEARLVYCQAPPGVSGVLLDTDLVRELAAKNTPLGWTFSYKPDAPQRDLIFHVCNLEVPQAVRFATGRLVADTDRSFARLERLLAELPDPSAEQIGRWLIDTESTRVDEMPREVELELTTADPYPNTLHHPRGVRVPARGPIEVDLAARVAEELAVYDDSLLMLGGFGDPLLHPEFSTLLKAISRQGGSHCGAKGVAVRTCGSNLNDAIIAALIDSRVDVLQVVLDAWTPETYAAIHALGDGSAAELNTVVERIDALTEEKEKRGSVCPIVVPEFTKSRLNVQELDDFHDGWLRRVGAVSITGYAHRAGQLEDYSVIRMTPPSRTPCHRLGDRCVVLADGRVVACDQDFARRNVLGNLRDNSLAEIWRGVEFERLRGAHRAGTYECAPLCGRCDEWHRR